MYAQERTLILSNWVASYSSVQFPLRGQSIPIQNKDELCYRKLKQESTTPVYSSHTADLPETLLFQALLKFSAWRLACRPCSCSLIEKRAWLRVSMCLWIDRPVYTEGLTDGSGACSIPPGPVLNTYWSVVNDRTSCLIGEACGTSEKKFRPTSCLV